jgi:hypothetical protein
VSVADGPNAAKSIKTDSSGAYNFTGLQQSGFSVNVSATNYVSQSKGVTLTSNQTLSFQLVRLRGAVTITFDGLSINGSSFTTYTETGFTVVATSDSWVVVTTYGHPAPYINFRVEADNTITREIKVTAGAAAFGFQSVDLYSSTTRIPYRITGLRNATTTFVLTDTLPNTFGNFATVLNPRALDLIDTLVLSLSNSANPCCPNVAGIDNIVVSN